ncbi:MAG: Opacity protein and related surface antigen [Burkholderiaceae bacterium]|nr:Opacity protein and related surface antigen [Burkholderiaceae bacterium]
MNFRNFAITIALTAASHAALAGGFDGPFVQAGAGLAHSKTDIRFAGWFDAKPGNDDFNGVIAGGYSKSFGQFNLALSGHYILGHQNAGKTTQSYNAVDFEDVSMKLKHSWGVSFEPGINLSEKTLAYAKLGYGQTSGTWLLARHAVSDYHSGEPTFRGFSFGAGVKHKFTANLYAFGEIQQTNYRRKDVQMTVLGVTYTDSFKPETLTAFAGIGYRF